MLNGALGSVPLKTHDIGVHYQLATCSWTPSGSFKASGRIKDHSGIFIGHTISSGNIHHVEG